MELKYYVVQSSLFRDPSKFWRKSSFKSVNLLDYDIGIFEGTKVFSDQAYTHIGITLTDYSDK